MDAPDKVQTPAARGWISKRPGQLEFPSIWFDRNSIILQANRAAEELLGEEQLTGIPFTTLVDENDLPSFFEHLKRCRFHDGQPVISGLHLKVRSESLPVELVSIAPAPGAKSVIHNSILAARSHDLRLRDHDLLEQLFDTLHPPTVVLDSKLRVIKANRGFYRILRLNPETTLQKSFLKLPGVRFSSTVLRRHLKTVLLTGRPLLAQTVSSQIAAGKLQLTLLLNARRLNTGLSGNPCLGISLYNITERRQTERERERLVWKLKQLSSTLEASVDSRTAALRLANERLQELSALQVQTQESERRLLACELHDDLGQSLTGLKLILGQFSSDLPEPQRAQFRKAEEIVGDLMKKVRRLSVNLRPQILDDLGLKAAITWHAAQFREMAKIRLSVRFDRFDEKLPSPNEAITVYRVFQEALTNVLKHSNATSVAARLTCIGSCIDLRVRDNGKGFNFRTRWITGTGLSGLRERLQLLGGELEVHSTPGKGTTLIASLPLSRSRLATSGKDEE